MLLSLSGVKRKVNAPLRWPAMAPRCDPASSSLPVEEVDGENEEEDEEEKSTQEEEEGEEEEDGADVSVESELEEHGETREEAERRGFWDASEEASWCCEGVKRRETEEKEEDERLLSRSSDG